MVFVIDDMAIAAIIAAIAAASATGGAALLAGTGSGSVTTTTYSDGTSLKWRKDGRVAGIDPEDTVGHTIGAGFPVSSDGFRIGSDGTALERLNMGTFDIMRLSKSIADSTPFIVGEVQNMAGLMRDPKWIKILTESIFGDGGFRNFTGGQITKTFAGWPSEVASVVAQKPSVRKSIMDAFKKTYPNRAPLRASPKGSSTPLQTTGIHPEDTGGSGGVVVPPLILPGGTSELPIDSGSTGGVKIPGFDLGNPVAGGRTTTGGSKPKPIPVPIPTTGPNPPQKGPKKKDIDDDDEEVKEPKPAPKEPPKKDPKKPRLPSLPDEPIKETPIVAPKVKPATKKQVLWFAERTTGGQEILQSTTAERLSELTAWQLYDYTPALFTSDADNLLNTQNDQKIRARFSNNYVTETPIELDALPDTSNWVHPLRDTVPVPYPMRLEGAYSGKLYNHWSEDTPTYLDQRMEAVNNLHNTDLAQVLNASRNDGWTANDHQITDDRGKFSLLDGVDSSGLTILDFIMSN